MHLVDIYLEEPQRCTACGRWVRRGRMVHCPEQPGVFFCVLKCAVDFSFAPRKEPDATA